MLLEKKRLLITGVLTPQSIAYAVARTVQEAGAEVVLTSFGKAMGLTEKSARRLPEPADVLELDVNDEAHIGSVATELDRRWGGLDGVLHAIAFRDEPGEVEITAAVEVREPGDRHRELERVPVGPRDQVGRRLGDVVGIGGPQGCFLS